MEVEAGVGVGVEAGVGVGLKCGLCVLLLLCLFFVLGTDRTPAFCGIDVAVRAKHEDKCQTKRRPLRSLLP